MALFFARRVRATKKSRPRLPRPWFVSVIDNSSLSARSDIPLIVPEVNAQAIHELYAKKNIIANAELLDPRQNVCRALRSRCTNPHESNVFVVSRPTSRCPFGQGRDWTSCGTPQNQGRSITHRPAEPAAAVHQADRLNVIPPYRRLYGHAANTKEE